MTLSDAIKTPTSTISQWVGGMLACAVLVGIVSPAQAKDPKPGFAEFVVSLKAQAVSKGYSQTLVDSAFADVSYRQKVVHSDKNQPEIKQTLDTYLPKRVNDWVVKKARDQFKDNLPLLTKIGEQYGVQPQFIVALWGLESAFGKHLGEHPIFSALTTLAYDGRRGEFYQKQIFAALEIIKRGENSAEGLKSSWAGAMGQTQFMPTSFLHYAVDYDGDGKKDIWHNKADIFASIANYLQQEGWDQQVTWGRQVKLPAEFDLTMALPKGSKSLSQWLAKWREGEKPLQDWGQLGITRINGQTLPVRDIKATLILPDDGKGRAYLAYNNYKTLMHWNRSYYFVTSVGYLADRIHYPTIE